MGMVPAPNAAFLRLSDGKVVGVAKKATKGEGFTVVSQTPSPRARLRPPRPPARDEGRCRCAQHDRPDPRCGRHHQAGDHEVNA